jgi:TRAP-type uncharacterized transport system substrate-binding protein
LIAAFKRELANEHPHVRVEAVETPSLAASALAFKNHDVELAVVRSDDPNAADGRSVFVFRKLFAVVLVPSDSKAESIADLAGQRIGVLTSGPEIDPLARAVLDFYSIDDKRITRLTPADLANGLKHIRALLVVWPIGSGPIATAVQTFRKVTKKSLLFSTSRKPRLLRLATRRMRASIYRRAHSVAVQPHLLMIRNPFLQLF